MERRHAVNTTDDVTGPNASEPIITTQILQSDGGVFHNDSENNKTNTTSEGDAEDDRIDFNQIVAILYGLCSRVCLLRSCSIGG